MPMWESDKQNHIRARLSGSSGSRGYLKIQLIMTRMLHNEN